MDNTVLNQLLSYTKLLVGQNHLYGGDPRSGSKSLSLIVQGKPFPLKQRAGQPLVLEVVELANKDARRKRWVAVTDLDNKFPCAGLARAQWLPSPAPYMCFRIAVQEIEAWLLADREQAAKFFKVPLTSIPSNPDMLTSPLPKEVVLQLAQQGGLAGMTRGAGDTLDEGNLYTNRMSEFARLWWRPAIAAQNSPSLKKCIERLQQLSNGKTVN